MTKKEVFIVNRSIREIESCRFESCKKFTVQKGEVIYHKPMSFSLGSSLRVKTSQKLTDFAKYLDIASEILGPEYDRQRAKFENAQRYGNRQFIPHRLIYLEERMRFSIAGLSQNPPTADFPALCEISTFAFLLDRFKTNPAWRELVDELRQPTSFAHHLVSLIYVYVQRLRGNEVNFVRSAKSSSKEADLVQYTPYKDKIGVEVKAPLVLWSLDPDVDIDADKIIEKAWKKSRGQRSGETSFLVVGGLYLSLSTIGQLREAADRLFERKKNKAVLAIQIYTFSVTFHDVTSKEPLVLGPNSTMSPAHKYAVSVNPYYSGPVWLKESAREVDGFSIDENSEEITLRPSDRD